MKDRRNLVIRIIALRLNDESYSPHPPALLGRDCLVIWVTGGLVGLFCIVLIFALWHNDSELLNKVLPPLVAFVTLALNRLLKEGQKDDDQSSVED